MNRIEKFFCLANAAIVGACGGDPARSEAFHDSLDQGLLLPAGATVTSATFLITGPSDFATAGSVPVGESDEVQVTVGYLPVATGYELRVSALASDGVTHCEGSTAFDVADEGAVLTLSVRLACAQPTGDVSVVAAVNSCPVIDGLSASPLSPSLGGTSLLQIEAHDSDGGPAPLSYAWKVNGFTLPGRVAPSLNFLCSARGPVEVAGFVADGDPNPACATSAAATVSCQ